MEYLLDTPSIKISRMCTLTSPCMHMVQVSDHVSLMKWPEIAAILKQLEIDAIPETYPHYSDMSDRSDGGAKHCPCCKADLCA